MTATTARTVRLPTSATPNTPSSCASQPTTCWAVTIAPTGYDLDLLRLEAQCLALEHLQVVPLALELPLNLVQLSSPHAGGAAVVGWAVLRPGHLLYLIFSSLDGDLQISDVLLRLLEAMVVIHDLDAP
jgi:hypothetical protein